MTEPVEMATGLAPEGWPVPRPELAGERVMPLEGDKVYLVNADGVLQWIPDPDTYRNLFGDATDVNRMDISDLPMGPSLSVGAVLAKGNLSDQVYLVTNGEKRWITSPDVMERYHFKGEGIYHVPQILVDSIPSGTNWS